MEVGPDSNTQSPGVYVARHCPTTVLTWSSHSVRPRWFLRNEDGPWVDPARDEMFCDILPRRRTDTKDLRPV